MDTSSDVITAAVWVHVRDRRLLTVRPHGADVWFLPGGLPELGESLPEAAAREVEEEIGVRLHAAMLHQLLRVTAEAWGRPGMVDLVCFTGGPGLLEPPTAREEIAEVGWITSDDRDDCAAAIRLVIDHLEHQDMID